MSEFKGTQTKVFARENNDTDISTKENGLIATCFQSNIGFFDTITKETAISNRDLIIDAFNVRQQINCELSELLEQRNEMLEMLERLQVSFDWISKNCLLPKIKNQEDADLQIEHIPYNMQEIKQLISKITE